MDVLNYPLPWFFSIDAYSPLPEFKLGSFLYQPIFGYPCLPILRSIYIQAGYPLFALALFFLSCSMKDHEVSKTQAKYAGMIAGSLFYIYFFSWGAISCLAFFFIVLLLISSLNSTNELYVRNFESSAFTFLLWNLITALPALIYLLYSFSKENIAHDGFSMILPQYFNKVFYFSPFTFIFILIFAFLYFKSTNPTKNLKELFLLAIAILFSELILMNSQSVLGKLITPYHFLVFYLRPLWTGVVTLIILEMVSVRTSYRIALLLLVGALLPSTYNFGSALINKTEDVEFVELGKAIVQTVPLGDSVAMVPYESPFQKEANKDLVTLTAPYMLSSITGRTVNTWSMNEDSIELDILLGWIFSGEILSVGYCPRNYPALPGDVFNGIITWTEYNRAQLCFQYQKLIDDFSLCGSFKKFGFSYIVWEKNYSLQTPDWQRRYTDVVWKSSKEQYELRKIRKTELLTEICTN